MASFNKYMLVVLAVVLFVGTASFTEAQQNIPSCGQKLIPCYSAINTTGTPPADCCNSIREAVNNDTVCLCNLYNTPGLLQSFGITVEQALQLTRRCSLNADLSVCRTAPPPAGGPPPPESGADGRRMAWAVFSGLLLLWSSLLAY